MSLSKYSPMNLPVGFRFQPTEEELINHYLRLKMIGKDSDVVHVIAEVDYLLSDPWELPDKSRIKSDDQIWYFFCLRENSKWSQRTTKSGYWKITGRGRMINARDTKTCIGKKKIMVFHNHGGPIPGRGTNWVIHEYHLHPDHALPEHVCLLTPKLRPYVIYRLENKAAKKAGSPACEEGEPSSSSSIVADVEDPVATPANSEVPGRAEENADSPTGPLFSLDDCLTLEDITPILSDCHTEEGIFLDGLSWENPRDIFLDCINDDQQINTGMHMNHPTPENSLPQGPHAISSLENITEDTPGCYIGEPSDGVISGTRDQVGPTAIPNVYGQVDVNGDQNKMRASCGADESEELFGEFWDELYESYCRETENNLPNDSLQLTSLKRSHPPASVDTDVVGVGERSKRSRSLAPGELLP